MGDFPVTVSLQAGKGEIDNLRDSVQAAFNTPISVKVDFGSGKASGGLKSQTAGISSVSAALAQYGVTLKGVSGVKKSFDLEQARTVALMKVSAQASKVARLEAVRQRSAETKQLYTERQFISTKQSFSKWYSKHKDNIDANGGAEDASALIKKLGDPSQFTKGIGQANLEVAKFKQTYQDLGVEAKSSAQKSADAWRISTDFDKLASQARGYYEEHAKGIEKNSVLASRWEQIQEKMADPANWTPDGITQMRSEYAQLVNDTEKAGAHIETLGQRLQRLFGAHFNTALVMFALHALQQAVVQVYQNVIQLDSAMVDLQIASGKTRTEVQALMSEYNSMAKELGATTLEVAESADTFLRQGKTVEETNKLIKDSTMLSKLGQIDSETASKNLTSAMKGYNVEAENAINIVDKLTAVDMVSASSAGDLATSMSETAVSANIAGVSMDKLIGQIAVISEVTQDGAESVGNSLKTMYARMGNVKAGELVDPESGETLSNVESVLSGYGIALRDSNSEFRNFGDVLDEVASKWDSFGSVAQHAIATAFAGRKACARTYRNIRMCA